MLCMRTGLEPPAEQVCLAEHSVQMEIERREEVPGAESQAGREDARVALPIHD